MEESSPLDQLVRDSLLFSLESPRISQKHLVPAAAVRLMKRRVLSRPGVNSLMSSPACSSLEISYVNSQPPGTRKKNRQAVWSYRNYSIILSSSMAIPFSFAPTFLFIWQLSFLLSSRFYRSWI